MEKQNTFKLILRTKTFIVPSNNIFLDDINPQIYHELKSKSYYYIKSNVRNQILRSFLQYLIYRTTPDIDVDSIHEYDLLSQEFDVMNNLIKLIKISKNSFPSLMNKNQKLKKSLKAKKNESSFNHAIFKQIINLLFKNYGFDTYSSFFQFHDELIDACKKQNVKSVDYLTRKKVEENGFFFILNEKEKTAILFRNNSPKKDIYVPKSIFYQSQEFVITSIAEKAFVYCDHIESIQFSEDSQLLEIESESFSSCTSLKYVSIPPTVTRIGDNAFDGCINLRSVRISEESELKSIGELAFANTAIESILIPSKVAELGRGFCCSVEKLANIKIMPDNKHFTYYEDRFLLGKSTEFSDIYDVLLYAFCDSETLHIPSFIKVIAEQSLSHKDNLKNVIFSEDSELVLIERSAFFFSAIESIFIPSKAIEISKHSFSNCSLNRIEFSRNSELKSIKNSSFSTCEIENISIPSSVIELDEFAFSHCKRIKTVNFIENSELKTIRSNVFFNSSISSFTIPSSVVVIEDGWCQNSLYLTDIKIMPNNRNFIYYDEKFILGKSSQMDENYDVLLFSRRDIEIVNISPFIKKISPFAFQFCKRIKKVDFSNISEIIFLGKYAFSNSSIEFITIPSSITRIESNTFSYCNNLKTVIFPSDSKLNSIGKNAFSEAAIEKVFIPSQVVKIGKFAFAKCRQLKSVEFARDSKLRIIGKKAFSFTSLEKVSFPQHITEITRTSFDRCNQLKTIEFTPNSELKCICECAFSYTAFESFPIPSNCIEIRDGWCSQMTNLKSIEIMPNNKHFFFYEGNFLLSKSFAKNQNFDVLLFARRDIEKASIPPFIRKISSYSFDYCSKLHKIDFLDESELLIIEKFAFCNSAIEYISVPEKATFIGKFAYSDCLRLKKISFAKNSKLNSICKYAFNYSSLENIVIPSNVCKMDDFSFNYCNDLQIVEISENSRLKSLKKSAFHGVKNVIIMASAKFCL